MTISLDVSEIVDKAVKQLNEAIRKVFEENRIIKFKRFDKSLPALVREYEDNAGFDLFARLDKPIILNPGEVAVIPLNVAVEMPTEAVGLVFQRSSTFRKWGIKLTNAVGVIDSRYRGDNDEWLAEFQNVVDKPVTINPGDKICQAVFVQLFPISKLVEVDRLGNPDRGGFGTSYDNASEMTGGNGQTKDS